MKKWRDELWSSRAGRSASCQIQNIIRPQSAVITETIDMS